MERLLKEAIDICLDELSETLNNLSQDSAAWAEI
jgi:hypothetical protein